MGTSNMLLTVDEARNMLRVSKGAIYEAISRGEIPSIRIGRVIRIPRAAFLKMIGGEAA